MKINVKQLVSGEIKEEDITPIYVCKHVNDRKLYKSLKDVEFFEKSEFIICEYPDSCYGFVVYSLWDKVNKIYEYCGFGHSGACSIVASLLRENIKMKNQLKEEKQ